MSPIFEHRVRFGTIARTVVYEDERGELCFCFDLNPEKNPKTGKWTLFLGRQASIGSTIVEPVGPQKDRIEAAWEKTKSYLVSCGYEVEEDSG